MAEKRAAQNTDKPVRGRPFVAGDERINKGGRPKNEVSLTAIARRYLAMTPRAIGEEVATLKSRYAKLGKGGSTMGELIVGSFLYALVNDPQPGNMRELWRRIDGEVAQVMEHASDPKRPVTINVVYGAASNTPEAAREADSVPAPSGEAESNRGGTARGEDHGSGDAGG